MEQIINCKYCDKPCRNLNSLRNHERLCKLNPKHIHSNLFVYNQRAEGSWNKGLTKETDERIAAQAKSITKERPNWQIEVDDDGKIYSRWLNKKNNAKKESLVCELTFQQYCLLVKEAGIKSSDLGFSRQSSGKKYVLARYNDQGNYTYSNCRFITQKQNYDEKVKTKEELTKGITAARKKLAEKKKNNMEQ